MLRNKLQVALIIHIWDHTKADGDDMEGPVPNGT